MPTIDQAVDFLIKNNALELGESPWPTYDDTEDVFEIDWRRLLLLRPQNLDNGFPYDDDWNPEISEEELNQLRQDLGAGPPDVGPPSQWDICAWYQPIHFFGHDWGIFIKEDCVLRAAMMIARFVSRTVVHVARPEMWFKALYRAATYVYFLHEQYHHKIESLGFRLHVVTRKSAFLPYHKTIYAPAKGTDHQLEEALANADCYHRLNNKPYAVWLTPHVVRAAKAYLKWQFPRDPPSYQRAVHYLDSPSFQAGENTLQTQIKEASLTPGQPTGEWDLAPRMTQSFFSVISNIWTVIPAGSKPRLPVSAVAPVRTCSTKEMIEIYKNAGYQLVSGGKGSHVKLKKAGAPMVILPGNRRELSPGVAKTALRALGKFNLHDLQRL